MMDAFFTFLQLQSQIARLNKYWILHYEQLQKTPLSRKILSRLRPILYPLPEKMGRTHTCDPLMHSSGGGGGGQGGRHRNCHIDLTITPFRENCPFYVALPGRFRVEV